MRSSATSCSRQFRLCLYVASMLAVTAAPAQVAGASTDIDASGDYQKEVQACKEGRSAEDQATCLLEARNAQAEKKRGRLDNGKGQFEANSRVRCEALKGDDKDACEARMMGHGQISGSVAGGGLLREIEVVIPPPTGSAGEATGRPLTGDAPASPACCAPTQR